MKKYFRAFGWLYLLAAAVFLSVTVVGDSAVTAWVERNALITRKSVVVIDAGHGGEDGGAVSCTGVSESTINLQIALRLEALMHLLGYETKMIRTSDVSVSTEGRTIAARKASDLRNRVRMVNETQNGVLVSVHQNLFAESRYSGAQVFYNGVGCARELAFSLQTAFVASINPDSNRKSKASQGVYLMEKAQRPAVLVECGFLSNPEEEAALRTGEYQKKIACVIGATLASFLPNT